MKLFGTFLQKPNGDRGILLIAKETRREAAEAECDYLSERDLIPLLSLAQLPVPFYLRPEDIIFDKIGEIGDMIHGVANNCCFCPPSMMV